MTDPLAPRPVDPADFDWTAASGPAADVRRIAAACASADGAVVLNEQAELQLKHRGLEGADLWLGDNGLALLHSDVLELAVHPDSRGRGLGTALARAALADRTGSVSAWSHADHPGAAGVARHVGLERSRELRIMSRPTALPVEVPPTPPGVRIRTFEPADETALLAVNAAAFAHHPEQGHLSVADFRERTREDWFDPEGLFVAVPDESGSQSFTQPALDLLGFHWTKVHRHEDPAYAEVYVVAANPKAAGRGIGKLLTAVGLQHLATTGVDEVILYVDGDNYPAIAVYEGLGFTLVRSEAQYSGVPRVD